MSPSTTFSQASFRGSTGASGAPGAWTAMQPAATFSASTTATGQPGASICAIMPISAPTVAVVTATAAAANPISVARCCSSANALIQEIAAANTAWPAMVASRMIAVCSHTLAVAPAISATVEPTAAIELRMALPHSMPRTPWVRRTSRHRADPATRPTLEVTTTTGRLTSPSAARRLWKVVPSRIGTNSRWVIA